MVVRTERRQVFFIVTRVPRQYFNACTPYLIPGRDDREGEGGGGNPEQGGVSVSRVVYAERGREGVPVELVVQTCKLIFILASAHDIAL